MIIRIINGVYRRLVLPFYTQSCIKREQEHEEQLVLQNMPSGSFSPLSEAEKTEVRALLGNYGGGKIEHFDELAFFKHYRGFDPRYISHYLYLPIIAHKLNNYHYTTMLEHKSLLGYLASGSLKFPHCYVRCVDGEYYDNQMLQQDKDKAIAACLQADAIVVKNSIESGGGRGVELIRMKNLSEAQRRKELLRVFSERKRDFVIQDCIKQHPSFSKFNSSSLNTLRVTTLYLNGKYTTLSIVLRFGKAGMSVDNWGSGGIIIGVSADGHINKTGYDIQLNEFTEYNGIKYDGQVIEQIPSLLKEIEHAHKYQFPLCKFIGWDVCFDENNTPVVIELNSSQPGIIGEQLCTGPIFGDRTKEVIDYCEKKEFKYQRSIFQY